VAIVARALPSDPDERPKRWNPAADLDGDERVTVLDLKIVVASLLDPDCRRGD
jgi:hypothetical protein